MVSNALAAWRREDRPGVPAGCSEGRRQGPQLAPLGLASVRRRETYARCSCKQGGRGLRTIAPHQFAAAESRVNLRGSGLGEGTCVISMRSGAERCMVISTSARTSGGNFGAPAMVSPNITARSRPPLPLACSRQEIWTEAATDMDGTKGLQQPTASVCGKVPYRLSSGFRPVKQLPFSCLPDTTDQPTRRYNHKDFEHSLANFEVCPRKRKREGWYLTLASTRAGGGGSTSTAGNLFVQNASEFRHEDEKQ